MLKRTRTATVGCARRISAAATSPSSAWPGGMRTSTMATSGTWARTSSMRSSASCARPTTSCPASLSSDAMPSRSSASSSATTTRRAVVAAGVALSAGVTSLEVMGASETNRGPVADARDLGRVEHAVARIVAETEQPVEVYDATLKAIGDAPTGASGQRGKRFDPRDGRLRCMRTWHDEAPGQRVRGPQRRAQRWRPARGCRGPRAGQRTARVDRRCAPGRELPAR